MQALLSGVRPWLILIGVCSLLYLPGVFVVPITDPDEARTMQSTRQMMQSGDGASVRFQDAVNVTAPPGRHWVQAAGVYVFSHFADTVAWSYRLPSFLGTLLAVLMVFRVGCSVFDRRVAFMAGLMMATLFLVVVQSVLATSHAFFLGLQTTAFSTMGMVYVQARGGRPAPAWAAYVFWLSVGGAILIQGFVTLFFIMTPALTLAVMDRRMDWLHGLRPVMGVLLCIALVAPWMASVSQATDGSFVKAFVSSDLLPKLLRPYDPWAVWPGTYTLFAMLTLWPASFLLGPAIVRSWQERTLPGMRFLLAWGIPSWVILELFPVKMPHNALPLYPALALMIAATVMAVRDDTRQLLWRRGAVIWYGVWTVVSVGIAIAPVWLSRFLGPEWSFAGVLAGVCVAIVILSVWRFLIKGLFLPAGVVGCLLSLPVYLCISTYVLPSLPSLWVSSSVVRALDRVVPGGRVASVGYHAPSLVFLAGTETRLLDPESAAQALETDQVDAAVVEARHLETFQSAFSSQMSLSEKAVIEGFQYARGRFVTLHLLTKSSP